MNINIFNKENQLVLDNLGLFSKKQVILIFITSILSPALLYFLGPAAFGIPSEKMSNANAYLWIVVSYVLCNFLLLYHFNDYTKFIIKVDSKKDKNEAYASFLSNVYNKKKKSFPLEKRFLFAIYFSFIPIGCAIGVMSIVSPGITLLSLTVFTTLLIFFLRIDGLSVMELVHKNEIEYEFRYSDSSAGVKVVNCFLNSALLLSVSFVFLGILIAYTVFSSSVSNIENAVNIYITYGFSSLVYLFFGSFYLFRSLYTYYEFCKNFDMAKDLFLNKLEKDGSFESMFLYYNVSNKRVLSLFDKFIQPIKILVAPTIMSFTQSKVITIEDLNYIYNWVFY